MQKIDLNGIWSLKEAGAGERIPVKVPGSVISGLLDNKKIPDPYYRRNEYEVRDLFQKDYEFERTFEVPEEVLQEEAVDLVCEGLDTLADIYVNGTLAASANNMHRTWRVPVKGLLKTGENQLRIVFRSVLQYIENYVYSENREVKNTPCGAMYGSHLLRKPHSMFGWDWGPQLPDAGIFRDIYLEGITGCRIEAVEISQNHEEAPAAVTLSMEAVLWGEAPAGAKMHCQLRNEEDGKVAAGNEVFLTGDSSRIPAVQFSVRDPKLWWPNGYGEQNLYTFEAVLLDPQGEVLDTWKRTIGLRTLTVSRQKDAWGEEFAFMVNGVKIFAMGGDYIPEDAVYSRITKERQEYLLESCRRANYNCIRVWGGGYYPSEEFYDLCDRKGLIVWQDLMYACNVYEVTDEFAENCRLEALENVKRLRHHASLGLWCGNNEMESGWVEWEAFQKESPQLRADYIRLFEEILPKAVKEADKNTFYWPSSPSSGGCFDDPSAENRGDVHYWDVWHGQKPFTDYQKYYFRFCSEFGFQSYPCLKTVKSYTDPSDRNVFSRVMESHQKNDAANGKILYYLSENFRYPDTFGHLLYVSQVLQGMAIKSGVDHWRRNRGRCMGAIYWQINDNWPVASWSSIDYFGRWKALHYMARRFYAPVTVSMVRNGQETAAYLSNESMESRKYKAVLMVKDMDCRVRKSVQAEGVIPAQTALEIAKLDIPELLESAGADEELFVEVQAELDNGEMLEDMDTFLPFKYMNLKKPTIHGSVLEDGQQYRIVLQTNCFAPFVELDFEDADVIFRDNYFHLTSPEPYTVVLDKKDILRGSFAGAEDLKERLRICSVADTYEA